MASTIDALSTRSVLLSGLLGTEPPRLPVAQLVRMGTLYGSTEGAVRTALSRLVARGEVKADGGWYELSPRHRQRQERQERSRRLRRMEWDGTWRALIVREGRRDRSHREALRRTLLAHRYAELREGTWMRPDNLDVAAPAEALEWCDLLVGARPEDPADLARRLWDHDGWTDDAEQLVDELTPLTARLLTGDEQALPSGFRLSAAVIRHLLDDPALPDELVGRAGVGDALRSTFDEFDGAFRAVLEEWVRADVDQHAGATSDS
ncbi:MAG: PaaX family transcriptional regulator C-terminal domain-containing protein [Actinomycetota bacterium]